MSHGSPHPSAPFPLLISVSCAPKPTTQEEEVEEEERRIREKLLQTENGGAAAVKPGDGAAGAADSGLSVVAEQSEQEGSSLST